MIWGIAMHSHPLQLLAEHSQQALLEHYLKSHFPSSVSCLVIKLLLKDLPLFQNWPVPVIILKISSHGNSIEATIINCGREAEHLQSLLSEWSVFCQAAVAAAGRGRLFR